MVTISDKSNLYLGWDLSSAAGGATPTASNTATHSLSGSPITDPTSYKMFRIQFSKKCSVFNVDRNIQQNNNKFGTVIVECSEEWTGECSRENFSKNDQQRLL